jgi:hypothetical protein
LGWALYSLLKSDSAKPHGRKARRGAGNFAGWIARLLIGPWQALGFSDTWRIGRRRMAVQYHPLSAEQVNQLISQGCSCADWSKVEVVDGFDPARVRAVHFCGQIRIGLFDKDVSFSGGVTKPAGMQNSTIHNCTIGNNVYIHQVRNYVANYKIEDDVVIENVDTLAVEGETSFGNGTEVEAVNEAGGREIPIYDELSAQIAYVMAFYRHRPRVIERIGGMISDYVASVRGSTGLVGRGSRIINCRIIRNVKIGPASVIEGANRLENGSVNSDPADPVYIGFGVFAEDFIFCSGCKVTDGVILGKCFVGQGTVLAKQYSAENSVFFANCGGFHGEACAIFAGPYTVTHHKSTLLIAGLFSFLNAGSGTNQSNHMYKLGPCHQGVVERGSKTASDSYMLWPAKVGAFTVVMGRHYRNSDTSSLPFSYLIEHEDESILVPGVNLRSVGTVRDSRKWPARDRRKAPKKLDLINFRLLSPYTIQKMLDGRQILEDLKTASGETCEYYTYHSVRIPNGSLYRGIEFYDMAIDKFLGNCLIKRLEGKQFSSVDELRKAVAPDTDVGPGHWVDLAGMFAPQQAVERMLDDVEAGSIGTLEQLTEAFGHMHESYSAYEWSWAANVLQQRIGKKLEEVTPDDIIQTTTRWKAAVIKLDHMLYADAKKEYASAAQIGYGLDGDLKTRQADFAAVRGTYESNSFVAEIEEHIKAKSALAEELIGRMQKLG